MASFRHVITAVDSHTAGEPTRIVTGGLQQVRGSTMAEKRDYLRQNLDHLRTALVLEPRGHDAMVLAYLTPPVTANAHTGVVFANNTGYLNMCGHGAIGVATVLVSLAMVEVQEPLTTVILDTPPGKVEAQVRVQGGRPESVSLQNVPSFLEHRDLEITLRGHGKVLVDIAYGGNWFALVPQAQVGIALEKENLRELLDFAARVREAICAAGIHGFDPETGVAQPIDHVEIVARRKVSMGMGAKTLTLCPGLAYDRSPCGTGTSAKLAALHARGELAPGVELHTQSILGTEFTARILEKTMVGDREAVIPEVRGSAYITGLQQFVIDPEDPLAFGIR